MKNIGNQYKNYNGKEKEFDELFNLMKAKLNSIKKQKAYSLGLDEMEIESTINISFWRAFYRWNKTCKFETFLFKCVHDDLVNLKKGHKIKIDFEKVSHLQVEQALFEADEAEKQLFDKIYNILMLYKPELAETLRLLNLGFSKKEIKELLKASSQRFSKITKELKVLVKILIESV